MLLSIIRDKRPTYPHTHTHTLQIVFDECHKAKNLCPVGSSKPTKTGSTVLELQRRLPNARIVYASATG